MRAVKDAASSVAVLILIRRSKRTRWGHLTVPYGAISRSHYDNAPQASWATPAKPHPNTAELAPARIEVFHDRKIRLERHRGGAKFTTDIHPVHYQDFT